MELAVSDREYGELSERVRGIQSDVGSLKVDMGANTRATNEILKRIAGLEGSWKALLGVAAAAAAIAGFIVKLLPIGFHF